MPIPFLQQYAGLHRIPGTVAYDQAFLHEMGIAGGVKGVDKKLHRFAQDTHLVRPDMAVRYALDAGFNSPMAALMANDAAIGGGLIFLESELEKRDPKVREPLIGLTFPRDIPIKTGGGWVDYTSVFNVNYGTPGPNQAAFQGTSANAIPIISADVGKDIYMVTNWGHIMKVTFIDMQKSSQVGRSLDSMYDKGIRTNWNISLNTAVYNGWGTNPGMLNNPNVLTTPLPNGASGFPQWTRKTPNEILLDFNTMIYTGWAASNFDLSGMPNRILIPPSLYGYLATVPISVAATTTGGVSLLKYMLENNLAVTQGRPLEIYPAPWTIAAGTGGSGRALAYVHDEDRIYFDVTVPVQRIMTQPTVAEGGAYLTLFLGQYGVVKYLAFEPPSYWDGIS
jgi:hypothetical protein